MSFTEVELLPRSKQDRLDKGLLRVMDEGKEFYTKWSRWGLKGSYYGNGSFIHFDNKQDRLPEGLIHLGDGDYINIDRIHHLNKEDCFIASRVYGDPHHPNVEALRTFRDNTLSQYFSGRAFTQFYYSGAGQMTADAIGHVPNSIPTIRKGLDFLVQKLKKKEL